MLNDLYNIVTPWATASKIQILKNRILGRIANYIYPLYCKAYPIKVNKKNNDENIVVSLTSFPARIDKVYLCINSILRQSRPANKVILWLANTQFIDKSKLPIKLLKLEEKGLEIKFCEDLKSYKKVFFTAQEYMQDIIITADDDTLYPENWVERLIDTHKKQPECVCCYRAHRITFCGNAIAPYNDWIGLSPNEIGPSNMLVPIGVGGVLYPCNYFDGIEFDSMKIREICPTTDDLWLKVIGVKKNISAVKVEPNSKEWFTLKNSQTSRLTSKNVGENINDISMKNLIEYYGIDSDGWNR